MPPLNEAHPSTCQSRCRYREHGGAKYLQIQDKLMRQFPNPKRYGKIGIGRDTEKAPLSMVETNVIVRPGERVSHAA